MCWTLYEKTTTVLDPAAVKDTLLFLSDQLLGDCLQTKLYREKDRQTDRQTGRQADRQTQRETETE